MIQHTHNLSQWATVYGRRAHLYRRPKKPGQRYTSPIFIGVKWLKSKAEAMKFKEQFDV